MEKERSPGHGHGPGGGLPPIPTSRYSPFPSPTGGGGGAFKPESSSSSPAAAAAAVGAGAQTQQQHFGQDGGRFSNDISKMPDFPSRNVGHRRAHSEILSLPDDISFDSDLGVVGCGDGPSLSDEAEDDIVSMYMDMEKFGASFSVTSGSALPEGSGGAVNASTPPLLPTAAAAAENPCPSSSSERPRIRHQHSQSMDGSTSIKSELLGSGSDGPSLADAKKAMSAAKLADLALVDPKRAKRIWANRQSAARSKERKMRYISELERKVQTLQTEATTLSAQLTMLQRDTTGLTAENSELKLRLQTMEQQVHLQDALNDALREEVQHLKMMTGQVMPNGGQVLNYGSSSFSANQPFYPQNHNMQSMLATHQLQQLNIHSQQQLHPNQLQQQTPPTELKIRAPMTSTNQNRRDSSSDSNGTPAKE